MVLTTMPLVGDLGACTYEVRSSLGSGGFSKVKAGRNLITGKKFAVKMMNKDHLRATNDLPRAYLEIDILKRLWHPNVAKLYEVVEDERSLNLVLELAEGGEVFDYIVAHGRLKEPRARSIFRQMLYAVEYIHSKGIAHRDLKPENFLLDANRNVKLIDFGLAACPRDLDRAKLSTCCGSVAYTAPEVFKYTHYAGPPADVWSLGVILYALLCGELPFDHDSDRVVKKRILAGVFDIPYFVSLEAEAVICGVLRDDPKKRPTAKQLLGHPWLAAKTPAPVPDHGVGYHGAKDAPDAGIVRDMAEYFGLSDTDVAAAVTQRAFGTITSTYLQLLARRDKDRSPRIDRALAMEWRTRAQPRVQGAASPLALRSDSDSDNAASNDATPEVGSPLEAPVVVSRVSTAARRRRPGASQPASAVAASASAAPLLVSASAPVSPSQSVEDLSAMAAAARTVRPKPPRRAPPPHRSPWSRHASCGTVVPGSPRHARPRGGGGRDARRARSELILESSAPSDGSHSTPVHSPEAPPEAPRPAQSQATKPGRRRRPGRPRAVTDAPKPILADPGLGPVTSVSAAGSAEDVGALPRSAFQLLSSTQDLVAPRTIQGIFNVRTTSVKEPRVILEALIAFFSDRACSWRCSGYAIYGRFKTGKGTVQLTAEVCGLSARSLYGVRLQRHKGDLFEHKSVCDELLSALRL